MDRCALFVDAGYVLTDGAMAVHGTRRRESVSWDSTGLLHMLGNLAAERTRLPLLRCYWYESTVEGRRSPEHDALADLPGVKVRLTKARQGQPDGVEGEMHRDLTTLARNKAVSDVMVVSAEEGLAQVIADVQDMGMRVTLLHISDDDSRSVSRTLRQECDDIVAIGAAQLRPFVGLIPGAEPAYQQASSGPRALPPAMALPAAPAPDLAANVDYSASVDYGAPNEYKHIAEYQQPEYSQVEYAQAEYSPAPVPERAPAPASPASAAASVIEHVDYNSALNYGSATDYGSVPDYTAPAPASLPEYATPAPMPEYVPVPVAASTPAPQREDYAKREEYAPREDYYAAPVVLPARVVEEAIPAADRNQLPGRAPSDVSGYNPGSLRERYAANADTNTMPSVGDAGRLQPVPAAAPNDGSAQIRRLPTRGAPSQAAPGQAQPPRGQAQGDAGSGQQHMGNSAPLGQSPLGQSPLGESPFGQSPMEQSFSGQPTGAQPVLPVAPVVPIDAGAMGYAGDRGAVRGGMQGPNSGAQQLPTRGAPAGQQAPQPAQPVPPAPQMMPPAPVAPQPPAAPQPQYGQQGQQGFGAPQAPQAPMGQQPPAAPQAPMGQQAPTVQQPPQAPQPPMGAQPDLNGQQQQQPGGPIGVVNPAGGYSGGPQDGNTGVSLADAVQSAHEEGQVFGDSVARDAPALWLEAVLARKPRMPSDLEARLLQGSALPIDFLLHDEVRHALRRGFWDALERTRR